MTLIVGLGNPGSKYKKTRHNIGFMVIDSLLCNYQSSNIQKSNFRGDLKKCDNMLFLKPSTYMNDSGLSVCAVKSYFKPEKTIVVHDDLDLQFGDIRFKNGGGHGGHNGLKSIDEHIGKDYDRLRFGIGRPEFKDDVSNFVLSSFETSNDDKLNDLIKNCKEALEFFCCNTLKDTANRFTVKIK